MCIRDRGYLSTSPVVRVRKDDDKYELTYKSKGLMVREEHNLPLTKESYEHLRAKIDGRLITKKRYCIPYGIYTIELDIFEGDLAPLVLAEVEFPTEDVYKRQTLYTAQGQIAVPVPNTGRKSRNAIKIAKSAE